MCFGFSKEPFQWGGSFEYPQHMFWLKNKKIIFSYALLSGGLQYLAERDAKPPTKHCTSIMAVQNQKLKSIHLRNQVGKDVQRLS